MRWLQSEYILKGLFLGLLLDVALIEAVPPGFDWSAPIPAGTRPPEFSWRAPALVGACALGGLAVGLFLAALLKLREGYRIRGRYGAFALFLLLESPTLVYAGIIGGTLLGAFVLRDFQGNDLLVPLAAGGAALGVLLGILRHIHEGRVRLVLSLAMAVSLLGLAVYVFG